ncbi:hypothetical protein CXB51_009198 [Gossypium anomalum]|uniref:Uncharacterized protein n=1 Tax=Gossypium anomalum TaxID=47600 RepID=A0A8J6D640_9ROSI|nr:hypothetical protein CXB51_009198 [Gossypium anomalum]
MITSTFEGASSIQYLGLSQCHPQLAISWVALFAALGTKQENRKLIALNAHVVKTHFLGKDNHLKACMRYCCYWILNIFDWVSTCPLTMPWLFLIITPAVALCICCW